MMPMDDNVVREAHDMLELFTTAGLIHSLSGSLAMFFVLMIFSAPFRNAVIGLIGGGSKRNGQRDWRENVMARMEKLGNMLVQHERECEAHKATTDTKMDSFADSLRRMDNNIETIRDHLLAGVRK